ncbi:MAG: response regulator [Phycisphaerae bacterium]|nr:response regulator [Phycisphaerae bacterium]
MLHRRGTQTGRRLQTAYLALAALGVAAEGSMLVFNGAMLASHERAVGTHGEWTEILNVLNELAETAATAHVSLIAPDSTPARQHELEQSFVSRTQALIRNLRLVSSAEAAADLELRLGNAVAGMSRMCEMGRSHWRGDSGSPAPDGAETRRIAAELARAHADLSATLTGIRRKARGLLGEHLQDQLAFAESVRGVESVMAGVLALLIVGAWSYGRRRARAEAQAAAEREELIQRLERAGEEARSAIRAKDAFLATMSHEIRTPLTAMLGFGELMADPSTTPEQRAAFASTIRRSGDHLLGLINGILDLSKIEAGRCNVERVPTCPVWVAQEVTDLFRSRAREKGVALTVRFELPLPQLIASDPTRLRQILTNLVGNALKFTSVGSVTLSVQASGSDVIMRVADTGAGISPEQLRRLFTPFGQADDSTTRRFGGTGLGLTISRHLAQLLGGTLELTSTFGAGTTATLRVPRGQALGAPDLTTESSLREAIRAVAAEPASDRRSTEHTLRRVRVLVVDDAIENRRLLTLFLEKAGAIVTTATGGAEAVRLAHATGSSAPPFEVILMDMQMPDVDGYEATRRLRAAGFAGPIIAVTANAMAGDADRSRAAGCDDYLTKPINRAQLIDVCRSWASAGLRRAA